jgi:hypothetical protein
VTTQKIAVLDLVPSMHGSTARVGHTAASPRSSVNNRTTTTTTTRITATTTATTTTAGTTETFVGPPYLLLQKCLEHPGFVSTDGLANTLLQHRAVPPQESRIVRL